MKVIFEYNIVGQILLELGKIDDNTFVMNVKHPFSLFQAFAICLSSFDYKD